jgi:hypothetical protein
MQVQMWPVFGDAVVSCAVLRFTKANPRFVLLQELTKTVPAGARIVLCCSGRGDKDVNAAMRYFDMETGAIRDNLDQLT